MEKEFVIICYRRFFGVDTIAQICKVFLKYADAYMPVRLASYACISYRDPVRAA